MEFTNGGNMRLSKNFPMNELLTTSTGLANIPSEREKTALLYLANYLLQPIRDKFGKVTITSGFRSADVNSAIGGSPYSQHRKGEAADFETVAPLGEVYEWLVKDSKLAFGQAILESKHSANWIHLSLVRMEGKNQEALVYKNGVYSYYGIPKNGTQ
jgi:zinc D-Ala-D-Ala carboxypeptidase